LKDFISAGRVSNEKLLQLYHGEGLKEKFAEISNDIEAIFPSLLNNQDVQD
jgi:hypothetical protein